MRNVTGLISNFGCSISNLSLKVGCMYYWRKRLYAYASGGSRPVTM